MSAHKFLNAFLLIAVFLCLLVRISNQDPQRVHSLPLSSKGVDYTHPESSSLLRPNVAISGELSGGQSTELYIDLPENSYFRLKLHPRHIAVSLTLYSPTAEAIRQITCRDAGAASVSFISSSAGMHRLKVTSLDSNAVHGSYDLRLEVISAVSEKHKSYLLAEDLMADADRLFTEYKVESTRAAIEKLKAALSSWQEADESARRADTLRRIADLYQVLGDFQNSVTFYEQALSAARRAHNEEIEIQVLCGVSFVRILMGEMDHARRDATRALRLSRKIGNKAAEARSLSTTGEIYYWFGDLQKSLDLYQKALPLWEADGNRRGIAQTHAALGFIYSDLGDTSSASISYQKALSGFDTITDHLGQAVTLTAMGRLYSRLGERQEALDLFRRAMELMHPIGNPIEEARILTGIAYTYNDLAEKRLAIEYYEKALALYRTTIYKGIKNTLYDLGGVHLSVGEYDKALQYFSEDLSLSIATADRRGKAYAIRGIGAIYAARGENTKALREYLSALTFYRAEKDRRGQADTLNLIGQIYNELDHSQARTSFLLAMDLGRQANYPLAEMASLANLASLDRKRGDLAGALTHTEAALTIAESLREKVASPDFRASYFSSVRQLYQLYIDVLMALHKNNPDQHYDIKAFEASERARARCLLDTLSAARVGIREKVDPELRNRERMLRQELTAKIERKLQMSTDVQASAAGVELQNEIEELTERYRDVSTQVRLKGLQFTDASQPKPLNLREIQAQGLDRDTLLLEFFLGDENSYLWIVSNESINGYVLPSKKTIEDVANRVRSLLTAPAPVEGESFADRETRLQNIQEQYWKEAAALSQMLFGQTGDTFGNKRLLVVPDGALQYIPFNALPAAGSTEDPRPLLLDHEIAYQSSASALVIMRNAARDRTPSKAIAVFADPVFEADDPRLRSTRSGDDAASKTGEDEQALHQALRDTGVSWAGRSIPRLLASREEATAVLEFASGDMNQEALDFSADKASATNPELRDYRIIHFATHGVFDNEHPELSGLLLSRFDPFGHQKEGFLRLDDIYNLDLSAELVVLSACNTGLGKDVKGEGLVGLVRGFIYAGTSRVVASLWKVDDDATAELMKHFYRKMLQERRSPSAALREAQLAMWQKQRWRAPYYWAAFVMQGEYSGTIDIRQRGSRLPWYLPAIGLLVVLFIAIRRVHSRR